MEEKQIGSYMKQIEEEKKIESENSKFDIFSQKGSLTTMQQLEKLRKELIKEMEKLMVSTMNNNTTEANLSSSVKVQSANIVELSPNEQTNSTSEQKSTPRNIIN